MPSLVDATAKASNLAVIQYVTNGSNVMGSTEYVVTYKLDQKATWEFMKAFAMSFLQQLWLQGKHTDPRYTYRS
jgi:hypothetical protein